MCKGSIEVGGEVRRLPDWVVSRVMV